MSAPIFNWRELLQPRLAPSATDSRRRLRWLFAGFVLAMFFVVARLWALELTTGEFVREQASKPLTRTVGLPAARGRIVTRDGVVLAEDRNLRALKLHYRYLEEPPNAEWLAYQARKRLSRGERRDPDRMAAALAQLRVARADLHRRLAALANLSLAEYDASRARVQQRVERIAREVNERQAARRAAEKPRELHGLWGWIADKLVTPPDAGQVRRIVVAEELDYHLLVADVPAVGAAEILAAPERFPGVELEVHQGRVYPQHALAANVVGHLGALDEEERAALLRADPYGDHEHAVRGRLGLELQSETALRGQNGLQEIQIDRRGETLATRVLRPPTPGREVTLTLDAGMQQSAERLLDAALARRKPSAAGKSAGGAAVVLDCRTGAVLACATAPRFDPNVMSRGPSSAIAGYLSAADKPLFDRAAKMAIPPGSVMKTLTAIALVESRVVAAHEKFYCQGFLNRPDQQRCALYRRQGVGHDELDLARALAESCNVYFFHHAPRLGPERLVAWSRRFGLGQPTGIELPHEATGRLPTPANIEQIEGHAWRTADTQSLSIGQSSLTVTPLQMARLMAAVANGGVLVTPHLLATTPTTRQPIAGLSDATLEAVKQGLQRAVLDPSGTAHDSLFLETLPVAAKTGTAETGGGRPDHAWIAGYAPAHAPQIAFAIAIEFAGDGGEAAGPVARGIVGKRKAESGKRR